MPFSANELAGDLRDMYLNTWNPEARARFEDLTLGPAWEGNQECRSILDKRGLESGKKTLETGQLS